MRSFLAAMKTLALTQCELGLAAVKTLALTPSELGTMGRC